MRDSRSFLIMRITFATPDRKKCERKKGREGEGEGGVGEGGSNATRCSLWHLETSHTCYASVNTTHAATLAELPSLPSCDCYSCSNSEK